jgi:hypothetical protein
MRTITYDDEARPEAGVTMPWEPDYSLQVMTATATPPEPLKDKD